MTRNWVTSPHALGTAVDTQCDVKCVSAGATEHIETPWKAFQQVFEFIAERFQDPKHQEIIE